MTDSPPPLTSSRTVLVVIALLSSLAPINSTMITVALPSVRIDFAANIADTAWLITAYLITMASLQPLAGKLGDLWGRRNLILISLIYFMISSVIAGISSSLPMLIAFRIQQAIAISIALPNGAALIREVMPEARRARGFGLIGAVTALSAASGPAIGGFLAGIAGWRAIFFVNVLIVIPALILGWRSLPSGRRERTGKPFDFLGSILLLMALVGAVFLLQQFRQDNNVRIMVPAIFLVVAVVIFFFWWEKKQIDPIIRLDFFKRRSFAAASGSVSFSNMAMYTTLLTIPILLMERPGWTSERVGIVLTALAGASVITSPFGGYLSDRFGRRWPTVGGLFLGVVGAVLLVALGLNISALMIVISLGLMGVGLGLASAGMQTSAVESAKPEESGVASGIFSTSRYLGSIVGSSLLSVFLVSQGDGINGFESVFILIVVASIAAFTVSFGIRSRPVETD